MTDIAPLPESLIDQLRDRLDRDGPPEAASIKAATHGFFSRFFLGRAAAPEKPRLRVFVSVTGRIRPGGGQVMHLPMDFRRRPAMPDPAPFVLAAPDPDLSTRHLCTHRIGLPVRAPP